MPEDAIPVWVFFKDGFVSVAQCDSEKEHMKRALGVEPHKAKLVFDNEVNIPSELFTDSFVYNVAISALDMLRENKVVQCHEYFKELEKKRCRE